MDSNLIAARARDFSRRAFERMENGGWARFDECMVGAANLVTIFLFARYLHSDAFVGFMLGYVGLLVALVVQPRNVLAAAPDPSSRRFSEVLAAPQAKWCIGLCVGLALAGCVALAFGQAVAGRVVLALAFVAVPFLGQEMVRWMLYAQGGLRAAAINDGVTCGLQIFGALVLVQAASQWATAGSALSVLGLSSAAGLAVGCWQLRRHGQSGERRDGEYGHAWIARERPHGHGQLA